MKNRASVWPLEPEHPMMHSLQHILADQRCGLCTDIDGTISATAPTVDAAVLLPGMHEILVQAVAAFELVATISGRAITDQQHLIAIPKIWHVGHHGYEWQEEVEGERTTSLYPGVEPYLDIIRIALDAIEEELAPLVPGLWMERKGITGGVHWRLAPDWEYAEQVCLPVIERIAAASGLKVRRSKLACELFPPIQTNKGEGLFRLIETHHLQSVLYLGDDLSDVDAFQLISVLREDHRIQGISIGVLHASAPERLTIASDMVIEQTSAVPDVLRWMIATRQRLRCELRANSSIASASDG